MYTYLEFPNGTISKFAQEKGTPARLRCINGQTILYQSCWSNSCLLEGEAMAYL